MPRGDRRSLFRSRTPTSLRAWLLTLGALLALSFLPGRWLAGWTSDVAGFANVLLTPSKDLVTRVRSWLRPPPDVLSGTSGAVRELELRYEEAIHRYRQLEIERDTLDERIRLLERARQLPGVGDRTRIRLGTVIGVTRPSARSAGALLLNVGAMHGVLPGMVVSTDGEVFVGRVAESVERFGATVVPATGLSGFTVQFYPPDSTLPNASPEGGNSRTSVSTLASRAPGEAWPRGVLIAKDGLWTVDLSQPGAIAVGWVAVLAEERWPRSSLGLRVGVVESVMARDDAPLMRRITVRGLLDPLRVQRVVLTDDADPGEADAPSRGGGQP